MNIETAFEELSESLTNLFAGNVKISFGTMADDTGEAPHAMWTCRPSRGRPWLVGYYTGRLKGGPFDGAFAAFAYKPVGKNRWERVVFTRCAKRSTAKKQALALYTKHSPLDKRFAKTKEVAS
jgi:hypothetical protein